jgi:L-threonylcarbamoyladenylate synthase
MTSYDLLFPDPQTRLLAPAEAAAVAAALHRGGLAVLPTETGYLLAAAATSTDAVGRAFAVKQRGLAHAMHIACASVRMAADYAVLTPPARLLLRTFTPGPLSVVVRQRGPLPDGYVTLNGTVGIRIPDHPAARQVIAALGQPVTATSLNRSGEETRPVDAAVLDSFDWQGLDAVPVVVDNDAIAYRDPSTLVRLTGPDVEVLRSGPVSTEAILGALTAAPARQYDTY